MKRKKKWKEKMLSLENYRAPQKKTFSFQVKQFLLNLGNHMTHGNWEFQVSTIKVVYNSFYFSLRVQKLGMET